MKAGKARKAWEARKARESSLEHTLQGEEPQAGPEWAGTWPGVTLLSEGGGLRGPGNQPMH